MLEASSGDAFVDGHSVSHDMGAIRQNLGVCPQFDILWPDITVREHLELYSAIKGYSRVAARDAALSAAQSVGESSSLAGRTKNGDRGKYRPRGYSIGQLSVQFAELRVPVLAKQTVLMRVDRWSPCHVQDLINASSLRSFDGGLGEPPSSV
jgi:hypothetical protein